MVILDGKFNSGICPLNESKENFDKIGGYEKSIWNEKKC